MGLSKKLLKNSSKIIQSLKIFMLEPHTQQINGFGQMVHQYSLLVSAYDLHCKFDILFTTHILTVSDKSQSVTVVASSLLYGQYVANNAIDGMIDFDSKITFLNKNHYLTITLPEALIIKRVKVFTSMVSCFQFKNLLIKY